MRQGELTERHARALLKLPNEGEKLKAIAHIVTLGMSVARTERYIEELLAMHREKEMQIVDNCRKVDVGAFLQSVNKTLANIQKSGVAAVSERRETDSQIVLTITIPK